MSPSVLPVPAGVLRSPRLALVLALAVLGCASLAAAMSPSQASASAYGIQYFSSFNANILGQTIPIPGGQLAHQVNGNGNSISSEWAHVTAGAGMCNWRVDYVYRDVNNVERRRINTGVHYRCDTWAYAPTVYPGVVPYGTACAQLYRSGVYVTKQCHYITR